MIISIIVPVYNVAPYLKRALDSILRAELQDCEIIVVDDGSTDDSAQILIAYQNIKNIHIITQENKGLSGARNTGLSVAQGKYVMFMDSDDYYNSESLQLLIDYIKNTDNDLVVFERINDKGISLEIPYHLMDKQYLQVNRYVEDALKLNVFRTNVWDKIYLKDLIEKYHIRFKEGLLYEDAAFVITFLSYSKKISTVSIPAYCYNLTNQGSITKCFREKDLDILAYLTDVAALPCGSMLHRLFNIVIQRWILSSIINKYCPFYFNKKHMAKSIIDSVLYDILVKRVLRENMRQKLFLHDKIIACLILHMPRLYIILMRILLSKQK